MRLPDYKPKTEVVQAPWAGDGRFSYGQFRHPIVKAPDGRLAVDVWVDHGRTMARVWMREDHPNLGKLPANAPRAVKALYRADGQLAELRADEFWSLPSRKAFKAWEAYIEAMRKHGERLI